MVAYDYRVLPLQDSHDLTLQSHAYSMQDRGAFKVVQNQLLTKHVISPHRNFLCPSDFLSQLANLDFDLAHPPS